MTTDARRPTIDDPGDRPRGPARAAGAGRGPAPARPRDAGHVGRRPGPRHARAPRVRAGRRRPAARPADLDRRLPPRRPLLLPARPGGAPDRWRFAARGHVRDRPRRHRRRRRDLVARRDRSAGSVAGFVAGLLMAVSASAVQESTFIWNPNLIALSSAVALAGAWHAWTTRRARWWLLAAAGVAATMQCHVLGVTLLPIVGALLVADARRRGPGPDRRAVLAAGLAGLGIIALTYIPLAIHEADDRVRRDCTPRSTGYRAGGEPTDQSPPVRAIVVLARVVSWPLTGLITDAPTAALLAVLLVVGIVVWRWRARDDRRARRRPLAGSRAAVDGRLPDVRGRRAWPGRAGPAQRPLPRVRRPDGLRARRDRRGRRLGAWRRSTPPADRLALADGDGPMRRTGAAPPAAAPPPPIARGSPCCWRWRSWLSSAGTC